MLAHEVRKAACKMMIILMVVLTFSPFHVAFLVVPDDLSPLMQVNGGQPPTVIFCETIL